MFSFLSKTNKSAAGSFQRNKNTGESPFKEVNINRIVHFHIFENLVVVPTKPQNNRDPNLIEN